MELLFIWSASAAQFDVKKLPTLNDRTNDRIYSVSTTMKYLISSFPMIKQVAYTHLPDTIWRPLDLGVVERPEAVVADAGNSRLFVADKGLKKIFVYDLVIEENGLLKTHGRRVAVNDVDAFWMAVNGIGDLYFSGQETSTSEVDPRSVYRMDEDKISQGISWGPTMIYDRENAQYPKSVAWLPSGLAVDSFDVYWANEEKGKEKGSVCRGSRRNIKFNPTKPLDVAVINQAVDRVLGMAMASMNIFYLTPKAIYGLDKRTDSRIEKDENIGIIQELPAGDWKPQSIAYDGEGTMYWTDTQATNGAIYEFPARDLNRHPVKKYVDAPLVHGITVFTRETGQYRSHKHRKVNLQSSASAVESGVGLNTNIRFETLLLVSLMVLFVQ